MKTLVLLLLVTTSTTTCMGQSQIRSNFLELNVGMAYIFEGLVFPGFSVLYGESVTTESNRIFEYELGLSFPTFATGKIGVGQYIGNAKLIVGIRPFPFNFYLQANFPGTQKGNWIISFEINPLKEDSPLSFYSRGNINVGYRWDKTK